MRRSILFDARKARDFGIGTYVVELIRGLDGLGAFDIHAVVAPADRGLFPKGVSLHVSAAGHYGATELIAVRRAIARVEPSLFHAPHYVVPLRPPERTVVTVHDLMHVMRPEHQTLAKRLYAPVMLRRAVRGAARLITVSQATLRDLVRFDSRAGPKTVVIPNGVSSRFSPGIPAAERERVRRDHGLDAPYLLFLGNDKPHKNLDGLLSAFALLREGGGVLHSLVLAGGAPERTTERSRAVALRGLAGAVTDLGRVPDDDVPPLVAEAAALVLPSFDEGYGLPVLEAQAAGIPVACSARGGLIEAAGDAALTFDPQSREAIAGAMRRLLTEEPLRAELVARGLHRAAGLTWARVAEQTAAVYEEVLGE